MILQLEPRKVLSHSNSSYLTSLGFQLDLKKAKIRRISAQFTASSLNRHQTSVYSANPDPGMLIEVPVKEKRFFQVFVNRTDRSQYIVDLVQPTGFDVENSGCCTVYSGQFLESDLECLQSLL